MVYWSFTNVFNNMNIWKKKLFSNPLKTQPLAFLRNVSNVFGQPLFHFKYDCKGPMNFVLKNSFLASKFDACIFDRPNYKHYIFQPKAILLLEISFCCDSAVFLKAKRVNLPSEINVPST